MLVAPWAVWALVRATGAEGGWPGVQLVAFTPYALAAALACGLLAALLRRRAPAAVAAATVLALALAVVPRATGHPVAASGATTLRVLSANLALGRVSPEAVVALVRAERVDVLSVQELTPEAARALAAAGLGDSLGEQVLIPRDGAAGTGIYARHALQARAADASTTFPMARAVLTGPGAPLEIVAVHPTAPVGRAWTAAWKWDLQVLRAGAGAGPPRLLAGDFNATLDHRELRRLLATGLHDAADAVGAGLLATWRGALAPPIAIDHVLVPDGVGVRRVETHPLPGGDHRALLAELTLPA
jgi:endonuclease/exonuclease/phosphatase (EEP) superfamily protein YafD